VIGIHRVFTQTGLVGIQSWAYQLQNIDPVQIGANTTFELVVMYINLILSQGFDGIPVSVKVEEDPDDAPYRLIQ
jgi:hypothetical protein